MISVFFDANVRDIFYLISGFSFLAIALLPFLRSIKMFSAPIFFILTGIALAFTPILLPLTDIATNDFHARFLEYFTEFVVIISLAGAGLAIDRRIGVYRWQHTLLLLFFVMPLMILVLIMVGHYALGLALPSAFLLAAVLSPTDPVLARSVQVEGPNKGEENDVNVSLTSEAGLNDGLAFPFVYLAIAMVAYIAASPAEQLDIIFNWIGYNLIYKVVGGTAIGALTGYLLTRFVFWHEDQYKSVSYNAGLILLASVLLTYGLAETLQTYGFLAVFIAALVARYRADVTKHVGIIRRSHLFSDQVEKICLALFLLWMGYYFYTHIYDYLQVSEVLFSFALILIIRPAIAYIGLLFTKGSKLDRFAISFLGIRGIGSIYYLIYAQNHAEFSGIDALWRITVLVVLLSIFIHGATAHSIMTKICNRKS